MALYGMGTFWPEQVGVDKVGLCGFGQGKLGPELVPESLTNEGPAVRALSERR